MTSTSLFPKNHIFQPREAAESSVAIIMRTKDRPILLARAICSVINQNFSDWHLFVINDSGCPVILQETLRPYMATLQGKLTLFNNETSLGMEAASNVAVKAIMAVNSRQNVTGIPPARRFAYCVVHDDDDSWHPDFLQETVAFLEKKENLCYAGVCTRVILIEEEIRDESVVCIREYPYRDFVRDINLWESFKVNQSPPIAFLFRVDLFDMVGLFNEHLPVLGDWDFMLRVLFQSDVGFVDKQLAYYHHRTSNRGGTDGIYGNSIIASNSLHQSQRKLFESAIFRSGIQETGGNGTFSILFALAQMEKSIRWETDKLSTKLAKLEKEIEQKNIIKKSVFKKITSFFYQNFIKHLLKLFNIPTPPPDKRKNILKRLKSFFYQVFAKHIINTINALKK